jgi:hypothetical protein
MVRLSDPWTLVDVVIFDAEPIGRFLQEAYRMNIAPHQFEFQVRGGASVYRLLGVYKEGIVPLLRALHAEGAYELLDHHTDKHLAGHFSPRSPNL